jgi:hypothetical protein
MACLHGTSVCARIHLSLWSLHLPGDVCCAPIPSLLVKAYTSRPRWLVEHDRIEAAKRNLAWLRALEPEHELVLAELKEMEVDVAQRQVATAQGWTVLFTNRPLFNRMWRASLLQFMAQMCGNTSMKYYLPSIFMSLGIERKLTLMIGGIESTLKIGCTIIDTWLVDRYGRRLTLVLSCLVMSVALLVGSLLLILALTLNTNTLISSTVPCLLHILTISIMRPTMPAFCLYSSIPLVIRSGLVQLLGSMAPRYVRT